MAGIYVHVPFCKQKCRYCDFTSFPDKLGYAESYMTCLYHEMAMRSEQLKGYTFDTLYIGGGTPSVIDESYIAMLVAAAKKYLNLSKDAEITIEMNPGTVTKDKIDLYKKCGINRFSVGLQTAIDSQLEDIGRCHNLNGFVECTKLLKGENFNVDVMIGLKNQTLDDIDKTIQVAAAFGASHISMYALTPEDGTPIYTDYLNGELPDSDDVAEMYAFGVDKLRGLGFERYEVSNFCKRGKESKHNLNYWRRGEYIGFGVSASSHIKNVRFTNTFDLDEYFKCVMTNHFPVVDEEEIDTNGQKDEMVMLALRTEKGMSITEFNKTFASYFLKEYSQPIAKNRKYLDITESRIRIKPEYLYVQNSIICDFM
ncbi:MAG: radical SAM family heme chaperone HemW, partial [Clostridia bacterium]|nr:radical SAM family heme chaperone HemW [Clostridia bacterium]